MQKNENQKSIEEKSEVTVETSPNEAKSVRTLKLSEAKKLVGGYFSHRS